MTTTSVTYLAAFGGGVVSFLSPCVLPLVPAYLSVITGLDLAEVQEGGGRHLGRIARDTGMFVAGFSVVFVLLGLSATAVGEALRNHLRLLTRVCGAVVLAMAVFLAGSLVARAPWLYQERRFHPSPSRFGPLAAPIAGAAFGFGWTPCIGPTLAAVLALGVNSGTTARGAFLAFVYSLGLGIPFLVAAFAMQRGVRAFGFARRHARFIMRAGGLMLITVGVLQVTGAWSQAVNWVQALYPSYSLPL
jgi:cytochrome c-type biogenesis protein